MTSAFNYCYTQNSLLGVYVFVYVFPKRKPFSFHLCKTIMKNLSVRGKTKCFKQQDIKRNIINK